MIFTFLVALFAPASGWAQAKSAARMAFDLPAASAERALKQFSASCGAEVVFVSESVANVRTNAVKGEYTPREAIERMLSGTKLAAKQDEKTGAITIVSAASANGRKGQGDPIADAPSSTKKKAKP